ncbi:MAG: amidohydrolase [Parvularculaceae bacterium]
MRTPSKTAAAALAALFLFSCGSKDAAPAKTRAENAADKVFYGGVIYTGLAEPRTVEAVAVKDGRISAIGAEALIDQTADEKTERIDLKGAAMYPGFVDSHAHLLGIGMRELTLNLEGVSSIDELVDIVSATAQETKEGDVIYGRGWIETGWPEKRFPNRHDLDQASADHPIVLFRADGHALVANSAAIEKAGVTDETPDPEGGRIERDENGAATGMFIDNAMNLIAPLIAAPDDAKKREAYATGAEVYADYGWTGLHNMSVDPNDLPIMIDEAKTGDIGIRIYNAIDQSGFNALAKDAPEIDGTGRIITRAVKLYMDGALGSRGASLDAPYSDQPDTSGLMLLKHDEALPIFEKALRDGVQICVHAIGDKGNRLLLDWFAEAFAAVPPEERKVKDPRWRDEHSQILHVDDIKRFKQLGIIASMQPSHAIGDFYFAPARLGEARLDGAYAWESLLKAGAVVAGGSDAPVERGDPRIEFYAAVARKDLQGNSGPDWRPEEKVTRDQALAMFTSAPAYASFQENDLGAIEPGKKADFTVFSEDIMTIPEAEILKVEPVMTVVDGEIVARGDADEDDGGSQ